MSNNDWQTRFAPAPPPEDRKRSSRTGWTRAHWEWAADALLEGARRHASPTHAWVRIPNGRVSGAGESSDGLEGYARTFLLASFRLAGSGGTAPGDLADRYASGLVAGTTPAGPDAWPAITDLSQPMVEAASVAIGLFETRPWIWDRLSDREREHAVAWLSSVHDKAYWPNNWLLFRVMVNAFLRSVGAPYRDDETERDLELVDSMYRRDGWYCDGPGQNFDHYVGWAIHLYTALWIRMGGESSHPERARIYRQRLQRFLVDLSHLFGASGSPLHQGRSLIYRFAATAPLWAGSLSGATPLSPGVTRRIASGCLRYFLEHGAARDGVLSMGWHGEHLPMAQAYSGPASPYWASKGFLGLLLPPEHEVWTAPEEPCAAEQQDFVYPIPATGWLAQGTAGDGIVRVYNHGSDHYPNLGAQATDPHYRKLVYTTHTAPETGIDGERADVDAQISLLGPDGAPSERAHIHSVGVFDRWACSVHFPGETTVLDGRPFPLWLERVESVSIAHAGFEIRIHHVSTFGPRRVRAGGFAVAGSDVPRAESGTVWAAAKTARGLTSAIAAVHGFSDAGIDERHGGNAFGVHSAAPYLVSAESDAAERICVCVAGLGRDLDVAVLRAAVADIRVSRRDVEIACCDGTTYFVQLVAADHIEQVVAGVPLVGAVRYARVDPDGSATVLDHRLF